MVRAMDAEPMMSRAEFNAFWLPKLREVNARLTPHHDAFNEADLDGLWHNYVMQQDDGLQNRADTIVSREGRA